MSLLTGELQKASLVRTLGSFDPRCLSFGIGRSLIAVAQFLTLSFTSTDALFQSILGQADAPVCVNVNIASFFCLGGERMPLWARQAVGALLLLFVASGYRPRFTVVLHAWIAFSLAGSIALPDGGDQAARVMCILFIPIGLADDRRWHWSRPSPLRRSNPRLIAISLAGMVALRLQIAAIYMQSAVAKLVDDWANGSAEYYIVRDPMFGASGFVRDALVAITNIPFALAAATWGPIVAELAIGVLILGPVSWRRWSLSIVVVLHVGIIITMGLWSFALTMIGGVIVAGAIGLSKRQPTNRREILDIAK